MALKEGIYAPTKYNKWTVLYFYPKDNTPGCTIEAQDFTKLKQEFDKLNAEIIGCSPDNEKSHCNFTEKQKLKIKLIPDTEKELIKKYDVWGKKKFMGREFMGVIRTTYLISPEGKIEKVWSPVSVKEHAEEVLTILRKLIV